MNTEFHNLDPLSEEFHDNYDPGLDHIFDMLDGDIYSQGIKVDHRSWLDMGSEGWQTTPDELKAAAYQVSTKIASWDESQIRSMMLRRYSHLTGTVVDLTLDTLRNLAMEHPLHIEDVNIRKAEELLLQHKKSPIIVPGEPAIPERRLVLELGVETSSNH